MRYNFALNCSMRRYLLILAVAAAPALAGDWFAIGLRAGAPLSDAFESVKRESFRFDPSTARFTIGPSAELFLPFGFGVEADLLYRRTEMKVTRPGAGGEPSVSKETVGNWDIPLLAKFRFPGAGLRLFVTAGGAYRSFGSLPSLATNLKESGWGFVMGGGLQIKIGRLRLSPELRFTRWGSGESAKGPALIEYNRNQADFLFGITF